MNTLNGTDQVAREASRLAAEMTQRSRQLKAARDEVQARINAGDGLDNPALFGEVRNVEDAWLWAEAKRKELDGRASVAMQAAHDTRTLVSNTERRLASLRKREADLVSSGSEANSADIVTTRRRISENADLLAKLVG